MVHRTDLVIDGHRVWLQDDTDASTSPVNVAMRIGAAMDAGAGKPVPDDSWKPRVAAMGSKLAMSIEVAQKELGAALDGAVSLAKIAD